MAKLKRAIKIDPYTRVIEEVRIPLTESSLKPIHAALGYGTTVVERHPGPGKSALWVACGISIERRPTFVILTPNGPVRFIGPALITGADGGKLTRKELALTRVQNIVHF